jgi:uncharacterized protein YjbI with pentapeptide repeats
VITFVVILFSFAVVTFPGELLEVRLPIWLYLPAFHNWLFNETPDVVSRRRLPFSNTLVLTGLNVYEGLGIDDPEKAKWHDFVFRARGRDLRGAIFDLATLPRVDFEGADLRNASFVEAQLQGASLRRAQLQGASFNDAQLQGVSLQGAQLQGAFLGRARLQAASFNDAELQGASLVDAQLQAASFNDAQLQGASLEGAQLQGASLQGAHLEGASLRNADLRGASLEGADLQGALLDGAVLGGASLAEANLWGASLRTANLQGASLHRVQLQGVSLASADLDATDLSGALLWRTLGETSKVTAKPEWRDEQGYDHSWDQKAYWQLRTALESHPAGDDRDQELARIQRLDCSNSDLTLASCDLNTAPRHRPRLGERRWRRAGWTKRPTSPHLRRCWRTSSARATTRPFRLCAAPVGAAASN